MYIGKVCMETITCQCVTDDDPSMYYSNYRPVCGRPTGHAYT